MTMDEHQLNLEEMALECYAVATNDYECAFCGYICDAEDDMMDHILTHHLEMI